MKTRILRISATILDSCAVIVSCCRPWRLEPKAHIYPDYPVADLDPVLRKDSFTEEDYNLLYLQTGLGKPAVDEIRELYGDWRERLLRFQHNFFRKIDYVCEKNSPISREEAIVDEQGNYAHGTELAPVHEGYIFVTKSSHTYGWRNGHSALVVDAQNGKTLESVVLGQNSSIQDIGKWTVYPNFMLLRPKRAAYEGNAGNCTDSAGTAERYPLQPDDRHIQPQIRRQGQNKGYPLLTSDLAGIQLLWL